MNGVSKLPYKVKFELEYQQYNERLTRLPVPPLSGNQFGVSDELLKVVQDVKQKIVDQDLQFIPSNIYSQYATPALLNQGKKNASQTCPGCGEDNKKPVQCHFCGIFYCKNCCFRKRVLPNLSEPKDTHIQCQDCHAKFIKLLANQYFYQEFSTFNKIIDSTNNRLKKLEKQTKTKKDRIQAAEKKKKQLKMREGIILKQLKNQQKKVQDLQQKLQQIVKSKAEAIRKQQQRKQQERKKKQQQQQNKRRQQLQVETNKQKLLEQQIAAKRKKQQEQQQRRKRQIQAQEALKKHKQIEKQKQQMKRKQEQTEKQIKQQMIQMQQEKQRQKEKQLKRKIQQQKRLKQLKQLELQKQKRMLSQQEHKIHANQLRNLAKQMLRQNDTLNHTQTPSIPLFAAVTQNTNTSNKAPQPIVKVEDSPKQSLKVNSSFQQQNSPFKVLSSFNFIEQTQNKKSVTSSKTSESLAKNSLPDVNHQTQKIQKQKAQLTESTQKQQHTQQDGKKQQIPITQLLQKFESMPAIAINISQMTVNQLLDININPYTNQHQNKRRQSYLQKQKRISQLKLPTNQAQVNQISAQQKYQILRSSNISSSLIHSNRDQHEDQQQSPDPTGSKCNCSLM